MWLVPFLMEWQKLGYHILNTADHGMNQDGAHGGTTSEMREVPLYITAPDIEARGNTNETISQLQMAPTILKLLDIPIPETMKHPSIS